MCIAGYDLNVSFNDGHISTESQTHIPLHAFQVAQLCGIHVNVLDQSAKVVDVSDSDELAWLDQSIVEQGMSLVKQSRTAYFWFQYHENIFYYE